MCLNLWLTAADSRKLASAMSDRLSPEDWRRERALAALTRAMRGEDDDRPREPAQPKGSLLSMAPPVAAVKTAVEDEADWRRLAAERHRMARLRREASRRDSGLPVPGSEDQIRPQDEHESFPEPRAEAVCTESPVSEPASVEADPVTLAVADRKVSDGAAPEPSLEERVRRVGLRAAISSSRPAIYRLTLLGAVIGVAGAVLLWKQYGALMAFLPLVGVLAGLAAGLLLALVRSLQKRVEPLSAGPVPEPVKNGETPRFSGIKPQPSVDETLFASSGMASVPQTPSVEEIRASLRQFRAATQDLARRRDGR